ncbi:hypothetical protein [Dongshaea marina]|uniref:hypothetical protein n=1 Tax=Dongshaea marina TaxID=2047966 RepID=UPI000D3EC771|nr:hypothetical protein [Dongshaea marina]
MKLFAGIGTKHNWVASARQWFLAIMLLSLANAILMMSNQSQLLAVGPNLPYLLANSGLFGMLKSSTVYLMGSVLFAVIFGALWLAAGSSRAGRVIVALGIAVVLYGVDALSMLLRSNFDWVMLACHWYLWFVMLRALMQLKKESRVRSPNVALA